jgi:hypothetical protein
LSLVSKKPHVHKTNSAIENLELRIDPIQIGYKAGGFEPDYVSTSTVRSSPH